MYPYNSEIQPLPQYFLIVYNVQSIVSHMDQG